MTDARDTPQSERLWSLIATEADRFQVAHRSDLFELLATILAYYAARGTSPDVMLSPTLRAMIQRLLDETADGG